MFKRYIALIISFSILFASLIGRIGYLSIYSDYTVDRGYNSYSVTIDKRDINLYYSNGGRINNNESSYVAVIKPSYKTIGELSSVFSYSESKEIIEELKNGYPIIKNADNISTKYIPIYEVKKSKNTISQLVSRESSGLLSHIDNSFGERQLKFTLDAMGRMLQGDNGEIVEENYYSNKGYKLSIDSRVQSAVFNACNGLNQGCCVVMDINTGNILSMVTKPDNSYLNKCIMQYPIGSVFKLIVTACALENDLDLSYYCNGSIIVGDTTFSCQKNKAHGKEILKTALANSCNCYFVNLINILGKENIQNTAKKFGFYDTTILFNDWKIINANMPTDEDLNSLGELSLLGFGQGKITATPLQLCSALCTLSSGINTKPNLVIGEVSESGKINKYNINKGKQVFSFSDEMIKYMRYVVTNGTGYNADSCTHKSAGKTATIETSNSDINNTCFAGIYPYNNPKYAIVIYQEDGNSGAEDCCPIFRTIVENLDKL